MRTKNILLAALVLFIFALPASVHANSLNLTADQNNVFVTQGEIVNASLTLSTAIDDRIVLSIKDSKSWMSLSEVQPRLVAGENRTILFILNPDFKTTPGVYKVSIIGVSQETGDKVELELYISLLLGTETVRIERIIVDGDFKPFTDVNISVMLINGKSVTVHDLDANFTLMNESYSPIEHYSSIIDKLQYNTTTEKNITVRLGKGLPAGKYRIRLDLYDSEDKLMDYQYSPDFTIKSAAVFNKEYSTVIGFIGIGRKITLENAGNLPGTGSIEENIGLFSFLYSGDVPQTKDGSIYKWTFTLDPSQTMSVSYYINLLPIIIIIIVILIILWYLFNFVFTVKLRKKIINQRKLEDGARFSIGIEVHNETMKDIHEVVVRDFIPHVFVLEDNSPIKPITKKTPLGTELIWRLNDLRKGDARVVSYSIKSRIGVSGTVRLAAANARYKYRGLRFMKESNGVNLGTGEEAS